MWAPSEVNVRNTGRTEHLANPLYLPLEGAGFKRGRSNGAVFYRASDDLRVLVYGDDFLTLGDSEALESLDALLRSAYELKRERSALKRVTPKRFTS